MKVRVFVVAATFLISALSPAFGLVRPDVEFKVFQFPKDQAPKIDGNADDWAIVSDSYAVGTDQIKDTVHNVPMNTSDLDIKVKVGWVKGMNQLFFLYEAYDNYWDFKSTTLHNDIFEIVVDGDLSGGSLLPGSGMSAWDGYLFQGVYAQNYHIFTPAEGKAWCMVWGCQPWAAELPWANAAYSYSFKHGESGKLTLEFCITPFDYAPYAAPEKAIPSTLEENKVIGLSWAVLDYDNENAGDYDGFYNLSQKTTMYGDASDLVAFRLMPLETQFHKPIEAEWSFKVVDMLQSIVQFKDLSYGNITSWKWDFGDGSTSTEQNPTHKYAQPGMYYLVVLNVEGPDGSARMAKEGEPSVGGASTKVGEASRPGEFSLSQNYPNPFNPTTTISFTIPQKNHVNLAIYNVAGEKVADLADKEFPAGKSSIKWNAQGFASGMYFSKITVGDFTDTLKLVLLK